MVKAATIFGLLLIGNGLYGYLGSEAKSVTAFIPAFFGIAILLCGFGSALNEKLRKHLMHFSALVALLGALAAGGRLIPSLGKEEANGFVQVNLAIMTILCIGYLIACIRSFRAARKRREETAAAS